MNRVNELVYVAELGSWRGHDIKYRPSTNTFESESAGIKDAATLAEVKRAIDKQEQIKYAPVSVLYRGNGYRSFTTGHSYDALKPGVRASLIHNRPPREGYIWVRGDNGTLVKESVGNFTPDTPANRRILKEAVRLNKQAQELNKLADELIANLPPAPLPEAIEEE